MKNEEVILTELEKTDAVAVARMGQLARYDYTLLVALIES